MKMLSFAGRLIAANQLKPTTLLRDSDDVEAPDCRTNNEALCILSSAEETRHYLLHLTLLPPLCGMKIHDYRRSSFEYIYLMKD